MCLRRLRNLLIFTLHLFIKMNNIIIKMLQKFTIKNKIRLQNLDKKMMLNFQRSWALRSILNSKLIFMFAQSRNKKKLQNQEVDRHKAILATRLIKMIQRTPFNLGIYVMPKKQQETDVSPQFTDKIPNQNWKPLRQSILDYIDQYPEGQTSLKKPSPASIAKKILRSYFFGGVWIHKDFCGQDRFTGLFGQQPLEQIQKNFKDSIVQLNDSYEKNQTQEPDAYKMIEFCPTYLVTGQVFQRLSKRAYSFSTLLQIGQFGIGKSHSVVLYRSLSDMVFRYRHLYCKLGQQAPEGIDFQITKLMYWNIDLKKYQKKDILKSIQKQCYEAWKYFKKMRKREQNTTPPDIQILTKLGILLSSIYIKLGITPILVIDNINKIASAERRLKNRDDARVLMEKNIAEIKQSQLSDQQKQSQIYNLKTTFTRQHGQVADIKKLLQTISDLMRTKDELLKHFRQVYYLSSMNIETSLLQKLQLTGKSDNTQIREKKFKYHQFLQHPTSKSDIIEFIILLLGQRLLEININKQNLSTLTDQQTKLLNKGRQILLQIVNQKFEIPSPKAIWDKLKTYQDQKLQKLLSDFQFEQSQSNDKKIDQYKSEINEFFIKLTQEINQVFSTQIESQIQKFLSQTDQINYLQKKKIVLLHLLLAAKSKIKQRHESSDFQPNIITIETTNIFRYQQYQQQQKYRKQISQILDQNFFSYDSLNGFKCFLSENMIIQLLEKNQNDFLEALWTSYQNIYKLFQTKSMIGGLIETLIKKTISQGEGETCLKFKFQKRTIMSKSNESNFEDKANHFNQNNHQNEFTVAFDNVKCGENFFLPIPAKLPEKNIKEKKFLNFKMFYFLNSFKETLKKIPTGNHLFLPSKDGIKVFDQSKLIYLIIAQKKENEIILNVFDPTVGYSDGQQKIKKFLEEYLLFIDSSKNQIQLQGIKYKVALNYTVLLPRLPKDSITSYLNFAKIKEQKISYLKDIQNYNDGKKKSKDYQKEDFIRNSESIKDYGFADYGQTLEFYQSKGDNEPRNEILLRRVSVASFLDIEFKNKVQKRISLYKNLMERYRSELQERERQQQQQKRRKAQQNSNQKKGQN